MLIYAIIPIMTKIEDNIFGLTIGIKYLRSFRINDISGDIVDEILHGENSPFDIEYFTDIEQNSNGEKRLLNPVTKNYLRINTDDIIFGVRVDKNFEEKYEWLIKTIIPYFRDILFTKFKIFNIARIGIVFHHKFPTLNNKKLEKFVSEFTSEKVPNAENINLAFSKKATSKNALQKKNIHDFKNLIFSIATKKNAYFAAFDYQFFFDPIIREITQADLNPIAKEAKDFLRTEFYSWLNSYVDK